LQENVHVWKAAVGVHAEVVGVPASTAIVGGAAKQIPVTPRLLDVQVPVPEPVPCVTLEWQATGPWHDATSPPQ
jgi:hypothetical protein